MIVIVGGGGDSFRGGRGSGDGRDGCSDGGGGNGGVGTYIMMVTVDVLSSVGSAGDANGGGVLLAVRAAEERGKKGGVSTLDVNNA